MLAKSSVLEILTSIIFVILASTGVGQLQEQWVRAARSRFAMFGTPVVRESKAKSRQKSTKSKFDATFHSSLDLCGLSHNLKFSISGCNMFNTESPRFYDLKNLLTSYYKMDCSFIIRYRPIIFLFCRSVKILIYS